MLVSLLYPFYRCENGVFLKLKICIYLKSQIYKMMNLSWETRGSNLTTIFTNMLSLLERLL